MVRHVRLAVVAAMVTASIPALGCLRSLAGEQAIPVDRDATARLIGFVDDHFDDLFKRNQIVPAPIADDAEFLRRVSLDLIGRIPTTAEVVSFLEDDADDKRALTIRRLLDSPEHPQHFAEVWRGLLLPEVEVEAQWQYFIPGFEAWLRDRRAARSSFAEIVRELVALPISTNAQRPEMVMKDLRASNPIAFYAVKEADPAKIAASTTRLFLGISLECAQCHDHPFSSWTQTQFWNQAAFFGGVQRRGSSAFAPLWESAEFERLEQPGTDVQVAPRFLTANEDLPETVSAKRVALADWIVARDNPFFAKSIVNRLWAQLLGKGLIEPVDDMHIVDDATHQPLLTELADSFVASDFDLDHLIQLICGTQAYQRTTRITDVSQHSTESYGQQALRAMSGAQFFRSLSQAVGYQIDSDPLMIGRQQDPNRRRLVELFAPTANSTVPETSITQVLALMNSPFIQTAVSPESGWRLREILDSNSDDDAIFSQLVMATLSRPPTTAESEEIREQLRHVPATARAQFWGDVLWALLNAPEFRWNH